MHDAACTDSPFRGFLWLKHANVDEMYASQLYHSSLIYAVTLIRHD
ncbi:hypothetical protein C8N29_10760 [Agitococcus lubricus]|uniref:Uncharacterized protein n=1 Tax=Agitococcus lubricus TaxID=1077255 RepID=A0A2T5IZ56_9GAMM|nr:hypothetical protein C8N29_10760 [Agitococcus lubricus]